MYALVIIVVSIFALIFAQSSTNSSPSLVYFTNSKVLVDPDIYIVYWNYTDTSVIVELHVKANGWFGFGVTPSGGMNGADVIVAWIGNNKTSFTDRYIRGRSVLIDQQQDVTLLASQKINGYSIVRFTRKINTCDPNEQDMIIPPDTAQIIIAWSDYLPPEGEDIQYHQQNRRVLPFRYISGLPEPIQSNPNDNLESFTFNVSVIKFFFEMSFFRI